MSKARYVADLLADSGDVKATKLDEFGALKDLSNVGTLPAALQSQLVGPAGPAGAAGDAAGAVDASCMVQRCGLDRFQVSRYAQGHAKARMALTALTV